MIKTWHNNRISKILNEKFPKTFSLCDIDGVIRCHYDIDGVKQIRFIIYESKNENEKEMGKAQYLSLKMLEKAINWNKFDYESGLYIIKIIDEERELEWYKLEEYPRMRLIKTTTIEDIYKIFSCDEYKSDKMKYK
tara:strand:- start:107 stop:514 length:408 start_codon:yes stop_codon:yes gene_type:complete